VQLVLGLLDLVLLVLGLLVLDLLVLDLLVLDLLVLDLLVLDCCRLWAAAPVLLPLCCCLYQGLDFVYIGGLLHAVILDQHQVAAGGLVVVDHLVIMGGVIWGTLESYFC
jgi:hypothetical protein